jgi:hypothetical protein
VNPVFKDELIALLHKHKELGEYQNPHFIATILRTLEDYYGYTDDSLEEWVTDLWSM